MTEEETARVQAIEIALGNLVRVLERTGVLRRADLTDLLAAVTADLHRMKMPAPAGALEALTQRLP